MTARDIISRLVCDSCGLPSTFATATVDSQGRPGVIFLCAGHAERYHSSLARQDSPLFHLGEVLVAAEGPRRHVR